MLALRSADAVITEIGQEIGRDLGEESTLIVACRSG